MLRLWKVCFFLRAASDWKLFLFLPSIPTAQKKLSNKPPMSASRWGNGGMAMLTAARAAFSMEANGCETKRVSMERAVGLSLGPTDVEIVDVRLNPRNEIFEELPESRKLYSGCIVCIGLKFHLGVSTAFLICITRRLSGFLFDLQSMNLPVTGTRQAEYSTTNYPSFPKEDDQWKTGAIVKGSFQ